MAWGEPITESQVPEKLAMDFFQGKGWSPNQAAGIVGNLMHESDRMQPEAIGDSGASLGIAQWNSGRRKALENFAAKQGKPVNDLMTQLAFVHHELEGDEAGAGAALKNASTVQEATETFSKLYERPGTPHMSSRLKYAQQVSGQHGGGYAKPAPALKGSWGDPLTAEESQVSQAEFAQTKELAGAVAQAAGFGLSDEDLMAAVPGYEPQHEPGAPFQKFKEYFGLNREPWKPSPVEEQIFREAMGIAADQPEIEYTPEQIQAAETASRMVGAVADYIPTEEFLSGHHERDIVESETLKVMGQFVDGLSGHLTTAAKKVSFGETYAPETAIGKVAGQAASLLGLILGPGKLVGALTGSYFAPTFQGLNTVGQVIRQAAVQHGFNWGVLGFVGSVVPRLIEDENFNKFAVDTLKDTTLSALTGAALQWGGVFPRGFVGQSAKFATGFAALDYMRAGQGRWSTLPDFYNAYQKWDDQSQRNFSELAYSYLMDLFILSSVPNARETLNQVKQREILQEIARMNPDDVMDNVLKASGQYEKEFPSGERGQWEKEKAAPDYSPEKGSALYVPPQVAPPMTPEAKAQAIFSGGEVEIIKTAANPADAVRQLVPRLGSYERAQKFYDLYTSGNADVALKEFPELSSFATEQQRRSAGESTEGIPPLIQTPAIIREINPDVKPTIDLPAQGGGTPTRGISSPLPTAPSPKPEPSPLATTPTQGEIAPDNATGAFAGAKEGLTQAAQMTPEAEDAQKRLADRKGIAPEDLSYVGEADGLAYFNTKLPSGQDTTWSEKIGVEAAPSAKIKRPPVFRRKGDNPARAIERGDLAELVHASGGIDPKTIRDFISTKEERQRLGRLILKEGGFAPDVIFDELKGLYPEQFGHLRDAGDMVRYFLDGRYERNLNRGSIEQEAARHDQEVEDERQRLELSDKEAAKLQSDAEREVAAEMGDREALEELAKIGITVENFWDNSDTPEAKPYTAAELIPRVAQVKRAIPGISDEQANILAQNEDLFNQVARGNLSAKEKTDLLKKASLSHQGSFEDLGGNLFTQGTKKLYGGFPLGIDTSQVLADVKAGVKGAKQTLKDIFTDLKETLLPGSGKGEQFEDAKIAFFNMLGRKNEKTLQAMGKFIDFRDLLKNSKPEEWMMLAATWQRGGKTRTDMDRPVELYQEITDSLKPLLRQYRPEMQFQDNYMRQSYKNARDPEFRANIKNFLSGEPFLNFHDLDAQGRPRLYKATFDEENNTFRAEPTGEVGDTAVVAEEGKRGGTGQRILTGTQGFLRHKAISDWRTASMLGAVPKFKNLFDLMMWDIKDKLQFIYGNQFIRFGRDAGWLKYVRRMPVDWEKIKDPRGMIVHPYLKELEGETRPFEDLTGKITELDVQRAEAAIGTAEVFSPREAKNMRLNVPDAQTAEPGYDMTAKPDYEARVMQYHLAAPKPIARIINNYLSEGLRGKPWYEAYRNTIDPLRRIAVIGPYHLRFIMNASMAQGAGTVLTRGMGELVAGDMEAFGKTMKEGGLNAAGVQYLRQLQTGRAGAQALYGLSNDPIIKNKMRLMAETGGNLPDPESTIPLGKYMAKGLYQGLVELRKVHVFQSADAAMDALMEPVSRGVNFAKVGGFMTLENALSRRIDEKYAAMGDLTPEQAAQKEREHYLGCIDINKHLDNIYGQMNYDSLMVKKTIKDMLFFVIKFPGWNIGSGRWMANMVSGAIHGTGATNLEKDALRMGLGLVVNMGIYSSLMYWFINGKPPDDPVELFTKGVWTGGYTRTGNKEYVRDASYWRDVWGMLPVDQTGAFSPHKPVETIKAKLADIFRIPVEIFDNKEAYTNYQIFSPREPLKWPKEAGTYFGKQAVPYMIRGAYQGETPWAKYGPTIGWSRSPERLTSSPALQEMQSLSSAKAPVLVAVRDQEGRQVKRDLMGFAYQGDREGFMKAARTARADGQITTRQFKEAVKDGMEILRDPQYGPFRNRFRKIGNLGDAIHIYTIASPEERYAVRDLMVARWNRSDQESKGKYGAEYRQMWQAIREAGQ